VVMCDMDIKMVTIRINEFTQAKVIYVLDLAPGNRHGSCRWRWNSCHGVAIGAPVGPRPLRDGDRGKLRVARPVKWIPAWRGPYSDGVA
jgi:hypothetical protein